MIYLMVSLQKQVRPWCKRAACCLIAGLLLAGSQCLAQETGDYDDPAPEILSKSAFSTCVKLSAGATVLLETTEQINAADLSIGKILLLRVRIDVIVQDRVVIATGATAIGRVKNLEAGTYNDPAEVVVDVQYAVACDGQQVPLFGNERRFKAVRPGESVSLEPGQLLIAQVTNAVLIRMP